MDAPIIKVIRTLDTELELQNSALMARACIPCIHSMAPTDFTTCNVKRFRVVRIARGIKMTAHWILRTGPTAALHRRRTGVIQTARCAGDFHRRNNAFIGIPVRPVDHSDETYSQRITKPRPRPFIVNALKIFFF